MEPVAELAEALRGARHAVVLTGAGASTESGLPDFRSKEGLWQGVDPMKLASLTALHHNPVAFYSFYRHRLSKLQGARPSGVHIGLALLQHAGYIKAIITQNIDGLHQAAGSPEVIEMHGNLRECVCLGCDARYPSDLLDVDVSSVADVPKCPACQGILKPGVILFEEPLPAGAIDRAFAHTRAADLFIVIGSSLEVGPVNQLPVMTTGSLAILNRDPTHLDGHARWLIHEQAGSVITQIARHLGL
jgi:NAD-dependent deacetylase